jgi:4-hydroxy-3-polyprenylbenzoate decarboxylase
VAAASQDKKRLVVGVSGASGAVLALHLLRLVRELPDWETHLVITRGGEITLREETDAGPDGLKKLASVVHDNDDIGASIASGTFNTQGMLVIPCSMKTAAGIYSGYTDNLLLRAADVTIKEKRPLVLLARESPLSAIHLRNLYGLSRLGVFILPPLMSFYNRPASVDDMVHHIVCKALGVWGIPVPGFRHWQGRGSADAQ